LVKTYRNCVFYLNFILLPEMGGVRKIDSETGSEDYTPDPVSLQSVDSESGSVRIAMLLQTFFIHHTVHTESGFFPKIQVRIRKM